MTRNFSMGMTRPPSDGWVRLLAKPQKRAGILDMVLNRDSELADWAVATARQQLGPEPDTEIRARYAQTLASRGARCRERGTELAYALIPAKTGLLAAQIDVSMVRVSWRRPVLTLDMLEKTYAGSDARTVKLDTGRTVLPAGPAVRIFRHWANGDTPSDVAVSVTYLIRPPGIKNALMYCMYWVLADDHPQFIEIADRTAETLRVIDSE